MIVIGPLRVTLENFRSMFAPVRFSAARNIGRVIAPALASDTIELRKAPARAKCLTSLDLRVQSSTLNRIRTRSAA